MTEEEKYEDFKHNLAMLEFHENKVDYYKRKTREYIYAQESERVIVRKADSEKWHRDNEQRKK